MNVTFFVVVVMEAAGTRCDVCLVLKLSVCVEKKKRLEKVGDFFVVDASVVGLTNVVEEAAEKVTLLVVVVAVVML